MQICKNRCNKFLGYGRRGGKTLYQNNDMIFCSTCECHYIFTGNYCLCCHAKVRHQSWQSKRGRALKWKKFYSRQVAHAIDTNEEIEVLTIVSKISE